MKLLVIGGTRFLGRHLVAQALERGHEVTLLHRGRSGPQLFPQARHLLADRDGDLGVLAGSAQWDAAIDTSAYLPRQVRTVAAALQGRVGQYQLVSSISVYAGFDASTRDESLPLQTLADPATEVVDGSSYGGLKALCEQAAQAAFGSRCLIARPGLLVGPHDPTGRFSWWVQRFAAAAADSTRHAVIAPGDPAAPVQLIDARDAAAWLLLQAERGTGGVFNLSGPTQPATIGDLLQAARRTLAPQAQLVWVDEVFLASHGVRPWSDLPVWLNAASSDMHRIDLHRAIASGLQCRPWAETIADTAAWLETAAPAVDHGGPPRATVGLTPQREATLLADWSAANALHRHR